MHTVMLVDDERPARELLKLLINWDDAGFSIVCEASNGADALQKYRVYKPDLVIIDIQMPVMGGLELMQIIREECATQIFTVLSCHELFDYARAALKLGACDYLIKDSLTPKELLATLKKAQGLLPAQTELNGMTKYFPEISTYSPRIKRVVEFILQNFSQDIGLSSLADMFDIHKVHLARTFKEETGASIHEIILELRLEKAKLLLSDQNLKVSDIIEQIGFHNPQSFYSLFKKHTGVSPSEFRGSIGST